MATQIGRLSVSLSLSSQQFTAGAGKASASLSKLDARVAKSFNNLKGLAAGFVAGFGLHTFTSFLGDAVREADAGRKASAALGNTLRQTGNHTGYAQSQIEAFAGSLQKMTAIEDDAIISASAMLARFKISGPIFLNAQRLMTDLSIKTGSVESAALLLGKALQDPTRGVTALGRAGVGFSANQKLMIRDLVKSNDLLGAQTIILAQVDKAYGGLAKSQASAWDHMKTDTGNLKEAVGNLGGTKQGGGFADWIGRQVRGITEDVNDLSASLQNNKATWLDWGKGVWKATRIAQGVFYVDPEPMLNAAGQIAVQMETVIKNSADRIANAKMGAAAFENLSGRAPTTKAAPQREGITALVANTSAAINAMNAFRRNNSPEDRHQQAMAKKADQQIAVQKEIRDILQGQGKLAAADF